MGLLVVKGVLRVAQFWPRGGSDADTAVIEVVLTGKTPFTFIDGTGKRHSTRVFENAEVKGKFGPQAVISHDKRLNADKIRVRLQGIDAPELHFQPRVPGSKGKNGNFRQPMGETCSNALFTELSKLGQAELSCEVVSKVQKPSDVCDVYGRVVGDVVLVADGSRRDINHLLLREGWALPGFYNSMTDAEIKGLQADFNAAQAGARGLFSRKLVSTKLAIFDPSNRYQAGFSSFKPFSDKGSVNFPKFFRRQADHYVRRAVGKPVPADLLAFLKTKPDDLAIETARFLKHKGPGTAKEFKKQFRQLGTFIKNGKYPIGPEVVYWENDAKLVNAKTKKEITTW